MEKFNCFDKTHSFISKKIESIFLLARTVNQFSSISTQVFIVMNDALINYLMENEQQLLSLAFIIMFNENINDKAVVVSTVKANKMYSFSFT